MSIRPLHGHKYDPTGIYTRMDNEQLDEDLALRENLYANHRQTETDMVTSSLAKNVELQIEKAKPSSVAEAKAIAPQFASWIHESEAIHCPSPANCSVVPSQHWTTLSFSISTTLTFSATQLLKLKFPLSNPESFFNV